MGKPIAHVRVYGYLVIWKPEGQDPEPTKQHWRVDQCDEYRNLPAHYPVIEQAMDRVAFLRAKGVEARVAALLQDPYDDSAEFEEARIRE